jgi:signal transduction histidine kinase
LPADSTPFGVTIDNADTSLEYLRQRFDVGATAAKPGAQRGLGLDGMRERLLLIGGTLEIESAIGGGTTIFARITLDGQRSAA